MSGKHHPTKGREFTEHEALLVDGAIVHPAEISLGKARFLEAVGGPRRAGGDCEKPCTVRSHRWPDGRTLR